MTVTSEIQPIAEVEAAKERTFELTNRSKSKWVKKGQENASNPLTLNSPREYFLPMESRVWDKAAGRYLKTQYIIGSNTIYVDDRSFVNEKGELIAEKGLRSQGYDLKRELEAAKNKSIRFRNGLLFTDAYGADGMLLEFIRNHEDNEERPNSDKKDPTKFNLFNFRSLRKEDKAAVRIMDFEAETLAMNYAGQLRTKQKDGTFVYNAELINVLLNIFDEGVGLKDSDNVQKAEIIFRMAKANGAAFMKIINDTFDEYRIAIAKAVKFSILDITAKEAKLTIGTKKNTLLSFNGGNEEDRTDKLIMYFIGNLSGINNYREMHAQIEVDAIAAHKKG